ncbi:MAG: helix-turn-helix transcriptional regulator [Muribaculaceae bacterium]|nr:helix-turn-helix transcriptional regulator [Muribaculaceae bacterium]
MFNKQMLGERIKKVRGKKSQDVFSKEIGISRGALSYYENGEREPDAEIIYKICEHCSVSADYLLGFTDNQTTDTNLKAVCDYTGLSDNAIHMLKYYNNIHQKNKDELYFEIQNYFIEKEYLNLFCEALFSLRFHSGMCNGLIEHFNENKEKNNLYEKITETIQKCDLDRYKLIKLSEELANHFDVRTGSLKYALSKEDFIGMEAAQNAKHNPPKE